MSAKLVADEFTAAYKEGKCESAEQTALLTTCIECVAERVRNNDLPVEAGAKAAAEGEEADEAEEKNAADESGAPADESATMDDSTAEPAPPAAADASASADQEPKAADAQPEAAVASDVPAIDMAESVEPKAEPQIDEA